MYGFQGRLLRQRRLGGRLWGFRGSFGFADLCKFLRKCFADFYGEAAELLTKVTGWSCSPVELRRIGERIHTLKKLFNIREGWRTEDDWLPEPLLNEALSTLSG